jgi:hypothetical protein
MKGIWKLLDMGRNAMSQDTAVHWVGQQEISLTTTQPRGCSLCYHLDWQCRIFAKFRPEK